MTADPAGVARPLDVRCLPTRLARRCDPDSGSLPSPMSTRTLRNPSSGPPHTRCPGPSRGSLHQTCCPKFSREPPPPRLSVRVPLGGPIRPAAPSPLGDPPTFCTAPLGGPSIRPAVPSPLGDFPPPQTLCPGVSRGSLHQTRSRPFSGVPPSDLLY